MFYPMAPGPAPDKDHTVIAPVTFFIQMFYTLMLRLPVILKNRSMESTLVTVRTVE